MSIKSVQQSNVDNYDKNHSYNEYSDIISYWTRNPSWISLPAVANTEEKIVAVHQVFDANSNFVALGIISGNYNVNWGDGTSENVNAATVAYHEYSYIDTALDNTNAPVTLTDAGDLISRTNHGYSNGMEVNFYNIVSTTGLTTWKTYYVINANANDFQVSETVGGSAVTLTTDGSATLLNYKQALITITPQAGANLTSVNFNVKHSKTNLPAYSTGFLDLLISAPLMTTLTIGSASPTVYFNSLERVRVISSALTTFASKCQYLAALQDVYFVSTGTVTSTNAMFTGCTRLQSFPLFNTTTVTDMSQMFSGCYSLKTVPLFNTANVLDMTSMFSNCRALKTVPLFNTTKVTDMSLMFNGCDSLVTVPLFNTTKVTDMGTMFSGCSALESVPLFNTAAVTAMNSMFTNCVVLKSVPLFNTVNVDSMASMFSGCSSLLSVPLFNTANVTSMGSMFTNCSSLKTVPLFNTVKLTTAASMFSGCSALLSVPLFNTANVTSFASIFASCSALTSIPALNTANVSSFSSTFSSCSALESIPAFNTDKVTTMGSMFSACRNIKTIPAMNCKSIITTAGFTGTFTSCASVQKILLSNVATTLSVASLSLGRTELESFFNNLATANTVAGATLTISTNHGVGNSVIKTCTSTAGSNLITTSDTVGVLTGMQVTGGGSPITANLAVTFTDAGDLVGATAHSLQNNDIISFNSIVSTTGLTTWKTYYVINANANDFQVSETVGGSAVTLTTDGSGQARYKAVVDSVVTNTSITLSRVMPISNTSTYTFRELITAPALLKQWTITG